jgi:glycosyltransferase involved in cell wall biosynthesis
MKILAISHIFPPAIDGGSKVVYQLSHQLESQGHNVIYLSSDCSSTDDFVKPKYKKSKTLKIQHSKFLKIPVYHHLRRPLKFINLFIPKNSYFHQLLQIFQKGPIFKIIPFIRVSIKIIKFKPDLIIAGPLPTTVILYANFFKKILSAKLLINSSFHQSDPDFSRLPLIKTLQFADYLWTLTKYETDFFIKKLNINPKKIILAGNGVELNFLKTKKNKSKNKNLSPTILFIGSLTSHKRVDLLIKSFSTIYHLRPNTSLIIVGQKTLFFPQIEKLFKSLPKSVQKQIHFKFKISNKDLIKD